MTSYTSFAKILNNKKKTSEPSGLCHREIQYIKHLSRAELGIVTAFGVLTSSHSSLWLVSDVEAGFFPARSQAIFFFSPIAVHTFSSTFFLCWGLLFFFFISSSYFHLLWKHIEIGCISLFRFFPHHISCSASSFQFCTVLCLFQFPLLVYSHWFFIWWGSTVGWHISPCEAIH